MRAVFLRKDGSIVVGDAPMDARGNPHYEWFEAVIAPLTMDQTAHIEAHSIMTVTKRYYKALGRGDRWCAYEEM